MEIIISQNRFNRIRTQLINTHKETNYDGSTRKN